MSRSLTLAEEIHAQTKKESLAATCACEKFADYWVGLKFQLKTDKATGACLLGEPRTSLSSHYEFSNFTCASHSISTASDISRQKPMNCQHTVMGTNILCHCRRVPASDRKRALCECHPAKSAWIHCYASRSKALNHHCQEILLGWIAWDKTRHLQPVYTVSNHRTVSGRWPTTERRETGHPSFASQRNAREDPHWIHVLIYNNMCAERCLERAWHSFWWQGVTKQIQETVAQCEICIQNRPNRAEPIMSTPPPYTHTPVDHPLQDCSLGRRQHTSW